MKFDNYETLMSTAQMLMGQENPEEGAPFVMAVAESKDSHKCAALVAATGAQAFGLVKSIMSGLADNFKKEGIPVGLVMDHFTQMMFEALMKGYGAEDVAVYMAKKTVSLLEKDDDEEEAE